MSHKSLSLNELCGQARSVQVENAKIESNKQTVWATVIEKNQVNIGTG